MHVANSSELPENTIVHDAIQAHQHHAHHLSWFQVYFDEDRWTWSPQVEQMHGYRPGTTAPSTALVLSHVHPEDDRRVAAALSDVRRTHRPFSSHHRIIDTRHREHDVVLIGVPFYDSRGAILGLHGVYLRLRDLAIDQGDREDQRLRVRAATRC